VYGTRDQFPVVCTTYRLTEHYHYWTHHTNILNQLQPGFFIEIPEELANKLGIKNGGRAKVTSARGSIEGVAMVTKRLRTLTIDGKTLWHIGFPLHWGYEGDPKHIGPLANFLTPSAMDPNTWTPEFKTFLVKLEKAEEKVS
jgi:formate dehydrogenase major subunit